MAAAEGVQLNHIARESSDVKRLASFYQEILGFEQIETPNFGEFDVTWLRLSPSLSMHIIQRDPQSKLPVGPYAASSSIKDPKLLPRGHHVSFSVSNFDSFVQKLKEKGIETFQKTQPDGKTEQVFFFDPDAAIECGLQQMESRIYDCNLSSQIQLVQDWKWDRSDEQESFLKV